MDFINRLPYESKVELIEQVEKQLSYSFSRLDIEIADETKDEDNALLSPLT